jgi:hypothetical protein
VSTTLVATSVFNAVGVALAALALIAIVVWARRN